MSHIGPRTAVVVGMGQLGTLMAAGLVAGGAELVAIRRGELARLDALDHAEAIVLTVPEDALATVVGLVPEGLRDRVVLVQNELLPPTWRALGLASPTVAVVWFEKKADRPPIALLPTVVGGPLSEVMVQAIRAAGLPVERAEDAAALTAALVAKNLYIRVANLSGLAAEREGVAPGESRWPRGVRTMGELLGDHAEFARALAREVFAIDLAVVGEPDATTLSFDDAWGVAAAATRADPSHACKGRAAPARLARAAELARRLGVDAPIVLSLA